MKLNSKNLGGITVIELAGQMTVDNIYSLTKSIERIVFPFTGKIDDSAGKSHSEVILDMEGVEVIDSAGIGTIVFLTKKCRALGGDLKMVSVSPGVRRVLELVKLDKIFQIFNSLDDALKSFRL